MLHDLHQLLRHLYIIMPVIGVSSSHWPKPSGHNYLISVLMESRKYSFISRSVHKFAQTSYVYMS